MTLVEFLTARQDEREEQAECIHDLGCGMLRYDGPCDCGEPERVRAEVEAKRRIVEERQDAARLSETVAHGSGREWRAKLDALDMVLCQHALPHADHPDFQQEWRAT